ncbi:hypothetical protein F8388_005048 [Cannabis sativa]|uniref:DUF4283 domain-containing protein n=1 Tax=Cannabis sativa TaxID=3483 RepID=A0A7J6I3L4_CANSA|nr:hypothetical protein F8388_005048 [Cannabis sativa]KAF4402172.1 hypothetical protein G4B88_017684 [Cannabis sativa]
MDEILKKTHNLQVTDEDEEWEVDKSLSITVSKFNLRGRLYTNSEHSREFLKKVLGGIWRLKDVEWNIKIKEKFETGLFLTFTFAFESIQSRILTKMPWYLSNGVLILGKMENSNESWKNDLTSFPIWGRAWGVPIDLLTTNNTVRMVAKVGEVITVQNSDISKMVGNGIREGIQGDRHGMGKNSALEDTMKQPTTTIGRATTVSSSPSLVTMGDVRIGSMNGTDSRETNQGKIQQFLEGGSMHSSMDSGLKAGDIGKEETQGRSDDGSRGKRRIVEDYGDLGYGKLKKSATVLSKEIQDQDLYNIPVSYAQEALILDGSTPFVVGSCSKNIAK